MRHTIQYIQEKKNKGKKITMLTAYDYAMASLIDEIGVDMILVGDSLANVMLGLESTKEVSMVEMLHHAKAVNRGVRKSLLIGDMPFEAYQKDVEQAVCNAKKFIEEAGCDTVKVEWFDQCLEVVGLLIKEGFSVMGHVGLTPQRAEELGGFKVQGKNAASAQKIIEEALALEEKGCFSIVLECVPDPIAEIITKKLSIPTIGIGAGVYCDGQVLVSHDLLGLLNHHKPKFVKQYVDLRTPIFEAVQSFCYEVENGDFPDPLHSYSMKQEELEGLKKEIKI